MCWEKGVIEDGTPSVKILSTRFASRYRPKAGERRLPWSRQSPGSAVTLVVARSPKVTKIQTVLVEMVFELSELFAVVVLINWNKLETSCF